MQEQDLARHIETLTGQIRVCETDLRDPSIRQRGIERLRERIAAAEAETQKLRDQLAYEIEQAETVPKRLDAYRLELQELHRKKKLAANSSAISALKRLSSEMSQLATQDPRLVEIARQLEALEK